MTLILALGVAAVSLFPIYWATSRHDLLRGEMIAVAFNHRLFSSGREIADADLHRLVAGATWQAEPGLAFEGVTFTTTQTKTGGGASMTHNVTVTAKANLVVQPDARPGDRSVRMLLRAATDIAGNYGAKAPGRFDVTEVRVHAGEGDRRFRVGMRVLAGALGALGLIWAFRMVKPMLDTGDFLGLPGDRSG